MANFKTHIQFATIGSAAASTLLLNSYILSPKEALLCWVAGTVGGILPDVDSDNSHALSILFGFLGLLSCMAIAFYGINRFPILWIWGACVISFLTTSIALRSVFERFTVHRGVFHSVLAGVFFTFLSSAIAGLAGFASISSWFVGAFVGFGFLLHLILDEIYSVDFMGASLKRSFGSAFKLTSISDKFSTLAFVSATVILWIVSPTFEDFSLIILSPHTYSAIYTDLVRLQ